MVESAVWERGLQGPHRVFHLVLSLNLVQRKTNYSAPLGCMEQGLQIPQN